MQCNCMGVVLDLLLERICELGEPTHVHPHSQVIPLDIRRADVLRIGPALATERFRADKLGPAVTPLPLDRLAV